MMAGNSMKSDVLPMVVAGGWGTYVPHGMVWELEKAAAPLTAPKYHAIDHLGLLPQLILQIEAGEGISLSK